MFGVPRSRGQGKLCIAAGRLAYSAEAAAKAGKAELRTDTNGFAAVKEVEALMRRIFCTEDNEGSEDFDRFRTTDNTDNTDNTDRGSRRARLFVISLLPSFPSVQNS
jgi:hypothetical protein